MRTALALAAVLLGLSVAPQASAYHVNSGFPHWPAVGTVAVNGGGCAQPCLWLRLVDRTGYTGSTWLNETRPQVVGRIREGIDMSVQVTWAAGSRFDLCPAPTYECRYDEAFAATAVGSIMLARAGGQSSKVWCASLAPMPAYCGGNPNHVAKGVVGVNNLLSTVVHELGHQLGLGHRMLDDDYQCADGPSVMCGFGHTHFDGHDQAELNRAEMYGHVD